MLWGTPHLQRTMPQKLCPAAKLGFLSLLFSLRWLQDYFLSLKICIYCLSPSAFPPMASYPENFLLWPNGQGQLNTVWKKSQTSLIKPSINEKVKKRLKCCICLILYPLTSNQEIIYLSCNVFNIFIKQKNIRATLMKLSVTYGTPAFTILSLPLSRQSYLCLLTLCYLHMSMCQLYLYIH